MVAMWQDILNVLERGNSLYLLTVVKHSGSTPGRTGFKMMVASDGYISGSVGGGIMEFNLVEEARGWLTKKDFQIDVRRQVHKGHKTDASGMICSGEQTVAFIPLHPQDIDLVKRILSKLLNNDLCPIRINEAGIAISETLTESKYCANVDEKEGWFYTENLGFRESLYIVGGGHVSLAVSDLFVSLGFFVTVFDNRDNLNTLEFNHSAHQKKIIEFEEVAAHIPSDENGYVAIMTNKFTDDKLVLSKLMQSEYRYIGVLGSRSKLKTMWDALAKDGFTEKEISKIKGPIGLPIHSQTPMEIAVSIAAEIIKIRER